MTFELYTQDNAPEDARDQLADSQAAFGFVPNLHKALAASPVALKAYKELHTLAQKTSFDATELTVVWQTINVENECHYCVPAHSAIAQMQGVDAAVNDAVRNKTALPTEKLEALRAVTLEILNNRGHLSDAAKTRFEAAGYGNQQLLEIIVVLAQKTISNYTNHLAHTPVDEPFKSFI